MLNMIFVILGTQDKKFPRLLEAIQKKIDEGKIDEKEEIINYLAYAIQFIKTKLVGYVITEVVPRIDEDKRMVAKPLTEEQR